VKEIVVLSHAPAGADRRREAHEALAQVGPTGRDAVWPSILSGGQKQREALER
jgi:ABC-type polar amino acid transport system ATPase subunit